MFFNINLFQLKKKTYALTNINQRNRFKKVYMPITGTKKKQ